MKFFVFFYLKAEEKLTVEKVPLDDLSVLSYPCDILSPCALGNVYYIILVDEMLKLLNF